MSSHLAALERPRLQRVGCVSAALVGGKAAVRGAHEHALTGANHGDRGHLQ